MFASEVEIECFRHLPCTLRATTMKSSLASISISHLSSLPPGLFQEVNLQELPKLLPPSLCLHSLSTHTTTITITTTTITSITSSNHSSNSRSCYQGSLRILIASQLRAEIRVRQFLPYSSLQALWVQLSLLGALHTKTDTISSHQSGERERGRRTQPQLQAHCLSLYH